MKSKYALKEEQQRIERESVQRGIDRYMDQQEREAARGREFNTPVAERLLKASVRRLVPVFLEVQARALEHNLGSVGGKGKPLSYGWAVNLMSAEALAYLTVKSIVTLHSSEARLPYFAGRLGRIIRLEYWYTKAREAERKRAKDTGEFNRLEMLKRKVREVNPKTVNQWMRKLDDLGIETWDKKLSIHLGTVLLDAALPHLEDLVYITTTTAAYGKGYREYKVVRLCDSFIEQLAEAHEAVAMLRPWLMPMVCSPRPWEKGDDTFEGGYLNPVPRYVNGILRTEDNRSGAHYHTDVDSIPPDVVNAVNRLQETPWAINGFVLDCAKYAFDGDMGPLPYEPPLEMPARVEAEVWESMSRSEKGAAKADRARVHDHNNTQTEKKLTLMRVFTVADRMREYERIYFPHSLDWRGRAYPLPQDLHPQGSDMVKALLTFAERKPLGDRGWSWLQCHAASCYGLDKEDRTTQEMWVLEHWEQITQLGEKPWLQYPFWMQAEEPWQFLAACREIYLASASGNVYTYASNLPVSVDGSCNGLQHLSAMGLDEVGGAAVNLLPGPRQDVYQIVADKVAALVEPGSPWVGPVTRKTVKRGVMTTPYGVTPRGIATQLKQDGFTRGMPDELEAANYLKTHMLTAIKDTIIKGAEVMKWMQECADVLAQENQGISWTTPIGMKVTQRYMNPRVVQLRTIMGKVSIHTRPEEDATVNRRKQIHAVAPNIIHSFDAAHMMLVVLNMPEDTAFAMVHDSFGTHACDVDHLLDVTRATFVNIYRVNWFNLLAEDFRHYSGRETIVPPPERGNLDIEEVLESEYMFA